MKEYNRKEAVKYAKKWAYKRNPKYYNFDNVGGDCTSFVSQCIYAGAGIMNYSTYGWYYKDGYNKSASWSGVEYLYKFLTTNEQVGPFGREEQLNKLEKGDIIQLSFDGRTFGHTLIITDIKLENNNILIASHTEDSYNRNLNTYRYNKARGIKIEGVRY
ncbi:MAG: amidase [Clostridiales bacterium]|nr:amidase [Clostridiales bacterium]